MSHYHHLSISEREKILVLRTEGRNLREIAREFGCCVSTVSQKLTRNIHSNRGYLAVTAKKKYRNRKKKCRIRKLLSNLELPSLIKRIFLEEQC